MNLGLLIILLLWIGQSGLVPSDKKASYTIVGKPQTATHDKAFEVLRNKCNTCHSTKRRTEVFTKDNMDSLAPTIYEQVFVKEKMPKGRKVKLTEQERLDLKEWLEAVTSQH